MSETTARAASTTRRTTPRAKSAAAPFSPAAAKLIEQIQADTRAALLEELSAKDGGITVLHWPDAQDRRVRIDGDHISITDQRGNNIEMHRHRFEPASWVGQPHMAGYWHPAYWIGDQTMVDASGFKWRREIERMVCDDFGNLVEVPA